MFFLCFSNVFPMFLQCFYFFYCYLGSNVTLEIFAEELKELWSPGINIEGINYRIGVVNGIWDGRGFEQVTKT